MCRPIIITRGYFTSGTKPGKSLGARWGDAPDGARWGVESVVFSHIFRLLEGRPSGASMGE